MKTAGRKRRGFTLIEMLVVIAIIGIIAGMVVGLANLASNKKKAVVASAVINRLSLIIENYHSKLGFYPPDNVGNYTATSQANYEIESSMNQLLYELTGEKNYGGSPVIYTNFDGTTVTVKDLQLAYGRGGIANSNPDEPHNFYYPPPKPSDYAFVPNSTVPVEGLIVPLSSGPGTTTPNFVHYDSSSTNRHNATSFDVWVEYWAGTDRTTGQPTIITNGNW